MRLVDERRFAIFCGAIILTILAVINQNIKLNTEEKQTMIEIPQSTQEILIIQPIPKEELILKEPKQYYDIPLSHELQDFTKEMCDKYDVTFETILGIMKVESDFDHNNSTPNNSESGSSDGILQLNTNRKADIRWYAELTGIENFDPNNIYHNIEGGVAIYKSYKIYWENKGYTGEELIRVTCNSYNMGVSGFRKYIRNTGKISRAYDRAVIKYKNKLLTEGKNEQSEISSNEESRK
jgi:hypothetical protein